MGNVWYGTWRLDLPDGGRKPIKFRMGTREEIGFSKQEAYLALPNKLKEHSTAMEEAEAKPEAKQQQSKSKPGEVPETFAELVEEWKETDGPGIRKKSQTTFDHYAEALSAYFGKLNKKRIADIQRKDVVNFLNEQAERYSESSLRTMRTVLKDPQLRGAEPVHRAPARMAGQNCIGRSSRSEGHKDGAKAGAEPWHHRQTERAT